MNEIFLISPNFVRTQTNMSSNMQDKFLLSAIREAQDIDLQQIIGTKLYNRLLELVANDTIGDIENHNYKELVDKSRYFLAYSVISRVIVIASVKVDNVGANQTSDEHVDPISVNDVFKLEDYYNNKADHYKNMLQKFLIKNHSNYPELCSYDIDEIKSNLYSAASCNVWLGGRRGKQTKYISK